ncbi:MAG TPA: enoyl-CoA hydratase-related protein [Solirubrobacterales bacterium]|nr:enoyl-CoA hydratase-related protein [Solirubrobacterales bacterium]
MTWAIHYELQDEVAVITIDRPEVANAVDRPTAEALADAFRRVESSDDVTVAVLAGGERDVLRGRRPEGHAGTGSAASEPG